MESCLAIWLSSADRALLGQTARFTLELDPNDLFD
jgi:hypothetical protein